MKFLRRRHSEGQRVKDLRFEPRGLEDAPELKISWTDEEGIHQTAWVKCSTLRSMTIINEKKAKP